jgi:chemotaxis protein MotB
MNMTTPKSLPPIVIKKKSAHAGHHGGAWKVAYADFVTAMMSLFIVIWLLSSSQKVQEAVGGYFRDPSGTSKLSGSSMPSSEENFVVTKDNMQDLKEQLQKAIREVPKLDELKNHIDMTVTNEGLRIELTESAAGTFFDSGSAKISGGGDELLNVLAQELGKLPNKIAMEGHTDSKAYGLGTNYGNWELSSDRANAARRLMQQNGIRADQVTQVRGFADQKLRKLDAPLDPSNRRISLIVLYLTKKPDAKALAGGKDNDNSAEKPTPEKLGETPTKNSTEMPVVKAPENPTTKPAKGSPR